MHVDLSTLSQIIVDGMLNGTLYSLAAVGIALLFGVMDISNVAHGDLTAFGAYMSYVVVLALGPNPLMALIAGASIVGGISVLIEKGMFLPMRRQGRWVSETLLVLCLGLSIFLEAAMTAVWGADPKGTPAFFNIVWDVAGVHIFSSKFLASGVGLALLLLLMVFLKATKIGTAIRAVSQDAKVARSVGINLDRMYAITFAIAGSLAAAGGSLIAPLFYITPFMGFPITIKAFEIVVLGGLGSLMGAFLGSIIIGVSEALAVLFIGSQFKDAVGLLIMMLILIIRPQGILGKAIRRA